MFAKQNAQSANPKVRMLAAEKRFKSAEGALQRAEKDLERAAENIKRVKQEPGARVCPFNAHPCCIDYYEPWMWFLLRQSFSGAKHQTRHLPMHCWENIAFCGATVTIVWKHRIKCR